MTALQHATTELTVHDDAIRANTAYFTALTGGRVMAVLKADGFGHGDVARAVLAAGARSIGVTSIDEALRLRAAAVHAPVLSWLNPVDADFESAIAADIDLAVSSPALLHAIGRAALRVRQRARVHLHVDVGMARDGAPADTWASLCELASGSQRAGAVRVVGLMGHMSSADRPEHEQNRRERLVFANAVRTARRRGLAPSVRHLAATAATITGVGAGYDLHRIGAGLFGIDPSHTSAALRPALSLTTTVIATRPLAAGTGIGYGLDHVADRRTNLALLPLGYGDGLPRAASERASVLVRGRRCPLVGRFSMDSVVVDTGDDVLCPGEQAIVFGPGDAGEPTVTEWAAWADTIEHEIVTRIGSRVSRVLRTNTNTSTSTNTEEAASV
ncbi:alanine racemase [Curtobacterium sp. PhB130]|uniref:alanine racemase n=1 Tax=Curtobacterium sp. PhB130 TaxID=2485178 RepID=UPI000F4BAF46|nr:alanine racemase [Curtobacterium sp. PhB130]ROS77818.1 alanine racemase [Curtobacterium sp. PhB130]